MSQICFMVEAISETDSGCSTAIGWYWYLLPKSLAACLKLVSSKLKCPPRGSVFSEEGILEKHKLSLMTMQLRNKMVKLLRYIMLCSPTRLIGWYLIFFCYKVVGVEEELISSLFDIEGVVSLWN